MRSDADGRALPLIGQPAHFRFRGWYIRLVPSIVSLTNMFRLTDKRNLWRIERVFVIEFEQQLELLALVQRAIRPLHVNGPPAKEAQ